MSEINYQALRIAAENATPGEWCTDDYGVIADAGLNANYYIASCSGPDNRANKRFIAAANPATVLALLDELDSANGYASAYEAEKWHYHGLAESEGERADRAEKRVAELESIATDYGVKFQKAQDALKHQALLHKSQMEAAEKRIAELSKAASVNNHWKPDVCPITGRKFFMWIEHETLGYVPTYGGPFDSYTIPTRDSSGEFFCERYDHDFGGWVDSECLGLYLIDDKEQCRVYELEERVKELDAREISLPERSSMLHRTDFHEDYHTVMAYKVSDVIAAIRAAGIRIKGE
ncbi:ead/Ea22-like family protein [Salmonella enterica]|nr:ead/Ea22-like family protein [Salmonella enterica subsp. enterica serovar Kisangani]EDX6130934.1 ead/Ea22-like family protein [Salmonella enterica]